MKTLKSIFSILLVLAMAFSVIGCGEKEPTDNNNDFFTDSKNVISTESGSNSETQTTTSDKTSSTSSKNDNNKNTAGGKSWSEVLASMPKNLKGTTIEFFNWNPPSEYTGATAVIDKFTKETGIKVKWITQDYDTYLTKLASMVASNSAPDVARARGNISTNMLSFQPLSNAKYDFTDAAWDKDVMAEYTYNGKQYATTLKNTHLGSFSVMYYNKALIDKYDLDDPYKLWKSGKWTLNKFLSMCEEFKEESNYGYAAGANSWEGVSQIFGVCGPVSFDGKKYKSNLTDKAFLRATQTIADLHNTDNILMQWGAEDFDKGELLFWIGAGIYSRRLNSYFATLKQSGTLFSVPMPTVEGQAKYYQGFGECEAYALVKGGKNPQAVPYFLRYFLNPDNYDLDAFFTNNQVREVYEWAAKQPNKINTTSYWDKFNSDAFDGILKLKSTQIQSFVDSNANAINNRVKTYNEALAKLK